MRKYLDSYPYLVKEFDFKKNHPLTPKNLLLGSHKKVWWKCSKEHEWLAFVYNRTNGKGCPYCSSHKVSKENNLEYLFPKVAKEWHPTKNGNLKPKDVTKASNKKVWWLCSKGHEWLAVVSNRTSMSNNCPKCSHQSSRPEFRILSELETIFEKVDSKYRLKKTEIDIFLKDINVGIEYDGFYFHKNKKITDEKKNKFLKENSIKLIRVRHEPLPKINSLDVIVKKNELTKNDLNNIVKSIYNFCNEKYKSLIKNYLSKKSFTNEKSFNKYLSFFPSPIPEKSLASFNIKFVKEWNYEKNYPLTPQLFSVFSNNKVWWKCSKGHEWLAVVSSRTDGRGCPYCAGQKVSIDNNIKYLFPNIANEWHPTKNGNLKPEDVTKASGKKVWWRCSKGHEWLTTVYHRGRGTSCPYCSNIKRKLFSKKLN